MGQRANLIVVKNNNYDLYYTHWGANTLDTSLFWGPRHALSYIRSQQHIEKDQWLDNIWAEGGAVMDLDAKVLLWFGGESTLYDQHYRAAFLPLMQAVWKGWQLRWAGDGQAALAEYVRYPRELVTAGDAIFEEVNAASLDPVADGQPASYMSVLSVRDLDGNIRIIPLSRPVGAYLKSGPELLIDLHRMAAQDELRVPAEQDLQGGIHLDLPEKTLDFWVRYPHPADRASVAGRWPDWQVTPHFNTAGWQEKATGGRLVFLPDQHDHPVLEQIVGSLLRDNGKSAVEFFLNSVEAMRREGKQVTVNPDALSDSPFELSAAERRRILAQAVSEVYGRDHPAIDLIPEPDTPADDTPPDTAPAAGQTGRSRGLLSRLMDWLRDN